MRQSANSAVRFSSYSSLKVSAELLHCSFLTTFADVSAGEYTTWRGAADRHNVCNRRRCGHHHSLRDHAFRVRTCLKRFLCETDHNVKRCQDTNAVARSEAELPPFFPLCCTYIVRRRRPAVLGRRDPSACSFSGLFDPSSCYAVSQMSSYSYLVVLSSQST